MHTVTRENVTMFFEPTPYGFIEARRLARKVGGDLGTIEQVEITQDISEYRQVEPIYLCWECTVRLGLPTEHTAEPPHPAGTPLECERCGAIEDQHPGSVGDGC